MHYVLSSVVVSFRPPYDMHIEKKHTISVTGNTLLDSSCSGAEICRLDNEIHGEHYNILPPTDQASDLHK